MALRQRKQEGVSLDAVANGARDRPLSTTKFKDEKSGLRYNYEDRLSKAKVLKTSLLMIIMVLIVSYFLYQFYLLFSNILYDFYWYYLRDVKNPNYNSWKNYIDFFAVMIKIVVAYFAFKYINEKLLLTYDDSEELKNYI